MCFYAIWWTEDTYFTHLCNQYPVEKQKNFFMCLCNCYTSPRFPPRAALWNSNSGHWLCLSALCIVSSGAYSFVPGCMPCVQMNVYRSVWLYALPSCCWVGFSCVIFSHAHAFNVSRHLEGSQNEAPCTFWCSFLGWSSYTQVLLAPSPSPSFSTYECLPVASNVFFCSPPTQSEWLLWFCLGILLLCVRVSLIY